LFKETIDIYFQKPQMHKINSFSETTLFNAKHTFAISITVVSNLWISVLI